MKTKPMICLDEGDGIMAQALAQLSEDIGVNRLAWDAPVSRSWQRIEDNAFEPADVHFLVVAGEEVARELRAYAADLVAADDASDASEDEEADYEMEVREILKRYTSDALGRADRIDQNCVKAIEAVNAFAPGAVDFTSRPDTPVREAPATRGFDAFVRLEASLVWALEGLEGCSQRLETAEGVPDYILTPSAHYDNLLDKSRAYDDLTTTPEERAAEEGLLLRELQASTTSPHMS